MMDGGTPKAYVRVFPIQYTPLTGEVVFNKKIEINITVSPEPPQAVSLEPSSGAPVDYLIITRDMFAGTLENFVAWKQSKGLKVAVESVDDIVNNYSGRDVPEKIRNCIKQYYQDNNVKWVLLVGDADNDDGPQLAPPFYSTAISSDDNFIAAGRADGKVYLFGKTPTPNYILDKDWEVPTRYVWNPDDGFDDLFTGMSDDFTPTDYYYAGLDNDWDADVDNYFGESPLYSCQEEADWMAEVYVGRWPVRTVAELEAVMAKTINFENNPLPSRNFLYLGAEFGWNYTSKNLKENLRTVSTSEHKSIPSSLGARLLYQPDNLSFDNVINEINTYNPIFVNAAGHGSPEEVYLYWGGAFEDKSTESSLANSGFLQYSM